MVNNSVHVTVISDPSTGVRADSVAVDWLGRNLYWIDGVKSEIVAVRLNTATAKAPDYSVILDEDMDQPRSLTLLPQKGFVLCSLVCQQQ